MGWWWLGVVGLLHRCHLVALRVEDDEAAHEAEAFRRPRAKDHFGLTIVVQVGHCHLGFESFVQ